MRQIKIAERLHPFSHTPGEYCLLPKSSLRLQIFPALIIVHDLSESIPRLLAKIPVPIKGPVKEFTAQLNLEKGNIDVWGQSSEEYFHYRIFSALLPLQIALQIDKGLSTWKPKPLEQDPSFAIQQAAQSSITAERLSLGNHKSQDWDMVKRRSDLVEILPAWLRLGELIPSPKRISYEGTAALLNVCNKESKLEVYSTLQNLFKVAFEGILSPRLRDDQHQGFNFPTVPVSLSPLVLLTEGAKTIRTLFIRSDQNHIFILPCLPPQFHCGRFLQVQCAPLGLLDFEWTKKMVRRMIFYSQTDGAIHFHFPKEVHRFRLNGLIHPVEKPIEVLSGQIYTFDRFQK